jgi:hypothetical protein
VEAGRGLLLEEFHALFIREDTLKLGFSCHFMKVGSEEKVLLRGLKGFGGI